MAKAERQLIFTSLVILTLACPALAAGNGAWAPNAVALPHASEMHAQAVYRGVYLMAGGYNGTSLFRTTYGAAVSGGEITSFTQGTDQSTTLAYQAGVAAGGMFYLIGGLGPFYNPATAKTNVFSSVIQPDGTPGAWTADTSMPAANGNPRAVVWNGYIYVAGGQDSSENALSTVYYAKINNDGTIGSWTAGTALPQARRGHALFAYAGKIYVAGGKQDSATCLDSVYYNTIEADGSLGVSWTSTAALPAGVADMSAAVTSGYVYIIGGQGCPDCSAATAGVYYSQVQPDGSLGAWTAGSDFPEARWLHHSISWDGNIYAIGGRPACGDATDTVYVSTVSEGTDSTPPDFDGLVDVTSCGSGCLALEWGAATDTESSVEFAIYSAAISGGQDFSTPHYFAQRSPFEVIGLTDDTVYYFVVRAVDSSGNEDSNTAEIEAVAFAPVSFTKSLTANPVISGAGKPEVYYDGSIYHMWFAKNTPDIHYARSLDGQTWTDYPGNPAINHTSQGWHSLGVWPVQVIYDSGTYKMWEAGLGTGYAYSFDMVNWTEYGSNPVTADVIQSVMNDGGTYKFWGGDYYESADETSPVSAQSTNIGDYRSVIKDGDVFKVAYAESGTRDSVYVAAGYSGGRFITYTGAAALSQGSDGEFDDDDLLPTSLVRAGSDYHLWYEGNSQEGIGYANSSGVFPPALVDIDISPDPATAPMQTSLQLAAACNYAGVNPSCGAVSCDCTDAAIWESGDTGVATIDYFDLGSGNGLAYGVAPGAATITVTVGGISAEISIEIINNPPSAVTVFDGTAADIDFINTPNELSANWTESTDPEHDIAAYYYAVGTAAGATDVVDWTSTDTATSVTAAGLSLGEGGMYYFSVKAKDSTGLFGDASSSDGVTVSEALPASDVVSPADGAYPDSVTEITGTAADAGGSGLAFVDITIQRASDDNYWTGAVWGASQSWISVSGTTSWIISTGLPAWADGEEYTVQSRAGDVAGNYETPGAGNSFTYDSSAPPDVGGVYDGSGADEDFTGYSDQLIINWDASAESHSPVTYYYAVGTTAGATDTLDWTTAGSATGAALTGLSLDEGRDYYTSVKVTNAAGLESGIATSDGISADFTAPAVSIDTPEIGSQVSGSVSVQALITEIHPENWTLYYGPGISPAEWKEIDSGVAAGEISATWNTGTLSGVYTLNLVAEDCCGNSAQATVQVDVDNSYTLSGTIPGREWTLMSLPMEPAATSPLEQFGTAQKYKVLAWDNSVQSETYLHKYRYPEEVGAGGGMWVYSYEGDMPYSIPGTITDTTAGFTIQLTDGWNQAGTPFAHPFPWGQVVVRHSGTDYDLVSAADAGLISSTLYGYDSAAGSWVYNDTAAAMEPGTGYFIRAFADVQLVMAPGAGMSGGMARVVNRTPEFSLRLAVKSGGNSVAEIYMGAANFSSDEYDAEDAFEPPASPAGDNVSLAVLNESWNDKPGRYSKDIRKSTYTKGGVHVWSAAVGAVPAGESATLEWEDEEEIAEDYSLTITDESTGETTDMGTVDSMAFVSNGEEKIFTVRALRVADRTVNEILELASGWNLVGIPLTTESSIAAEIFAAVADEIHICQYSDGVFMDGEQADVQPGYSVWIHTVAPLKIPVSGIPADPDSGITAPLSEGWNTIANPFAESIVWDDNIRLIVSGETMSLTEAAGRGIVDSSLYEYTGTGYKKIERGEELEPWKGYLLRAEEECVLYIKR